MRAHSLRKLTIPAVAAVVAAALASCAMPPATATQVQASNPRVTYKYNTDEALIQANQSATTFCSQYQAVPRTVNFNSDVDGGKAVVFECLARQQQGVASYPALSPAMPASSPLTYTYRTDQELLDASRNAQNFCATTGSPRLLSTVTTNSLGMKTVAFQCGPL